MYFVSPVPNISALEVKNCFWFSKSVLSLMKNCQACWICSSVASFRSLIPKKLRKFIEDWKAKGLHSVLFLLVAKHISGHYCKALISFSIYCIFKRLPLLIRLPPSGFEWIKIRFWEAIDYDLSGWLIEDLLKACWAAKWESNEIVRGSEYMRKSLSPPGSSILKMPVEQTMMIDINENITMKANILPGFLTQHLIGSDI